MRNTLPAADHPNEFVAGNLALDFTNTLGGSRAEPSHEHITAYDDLVSFLTDAAAIDPAQGKRLRAEAARHPMLATQVHRRGIALREAIWRAFDEIAHRGQPADADLDLIGTEAAEAFAHANVARTSGGYGWTWPETNDLARVIWPIARAASELLMAEDRERVRECASATCTWLFLDRSRNHSRRWCDMDDCGNRAKARRFRERRRPAGSAARG